MTRCKITVIKKTLNPKPAKQYCAGKVTPCPCFQEGQEFLCGLKKPENFCDWAWRDIHPMVAVLLTGGNFSRWDVRWVDEGRPDHDRLLFRRCTAGYFRDRTD